MMKVTNVERYPLCWPEGWTRTPPYITFVVSTLTIACVAYGTCSP